MPPKRTTRPGKLTDDEQRFVDEYLIDRNATAAYARANPGVKRTTASTEGCKLLGKPKIVSAVKAASIELARSCKTSAIKEVRRLVMFAEADIGHAFDLTADDWVPLPPRQIPFETRRAIASCKYKKRDEYDRDGNKVATVVDAEYRFVDKLAACDKLMRHLGLYKDLPALEVLLGILPPELREQVRAALAGAVQQGPGGGGAAGDGPPPPLPPGPPPGPAAGGPDRALPGGGVQPGPVAESVPVGPGPSAADAVLPSGGQVDHVGGEDVGPLFD